MTGAVASVAAFGLVIFGAAGITAGYMGVPRRLFEIAYEGEAPAIWGPLMATVGVGATFMSAALAVYLYGLVRMLVGRLGQAGTALTELSVTSWGGAAAGRYSAWVGPLSVVVLIGATYPFTALAFELMQSLPIEATGGHEGH